jgi:flagella basal body P-ring formation protein FlgA
VSNAPLQRAAHFLRYTVLPWLRRQLLELQRDTRRQRIASAALATLAALAFLLVLLDLRATTDALGARATVYVAVGELRPGDTITAARVRAVEQPSSFLPPTALDTSPVGSTARQHIAPGEHLTSTNVHAQADDHVPAGWRVVAVTARAALPPLAAGAYVDVIARAEVLVSGAVVVSVHDDGRSAMVAVPASTAAVVATEAALGEATLAASG